MAQLAIKGHATRGKEVIEILKMLGGYNRLDWTGYDKYKLYTLSNSGVMDIIEPARMKHNCSSFTLKQFLEKFPYKVGDKVITKHPDDHKGSLIFEIGSMKWDNHSNRVLYKGEIDDLLEFSAEDLQPYTEQSYLNPKAEKMREKIKENLEKVRKDLDWHPTDYLEFVDNDEFADEVELNLGDSYEIQVRYGKTFAVKKQPKYPETYEECCKMLGYEPDRQTVTGYDAELIENLQTLKLCRDAYWKMAGDWKYDVNKTEEYFYIVNKCGHIVKEHCMNFNHILSFPTEDMRDAFYENFKELIETVKELL